MSDIAIRVKNLSKQYKIVSPHHSHDTLRDKVADGLKSLFRRYSTLHDETLWALKDVSFEVKHGEVIGLIGRNGAGKSTLLKILSRITEPTKGRVEIFGRVSSLLEVGTGFHPELTGRDNIYLSGAILGMRKTEIDQRFDEIVAFAEVTKFIDTPVKRYSSGMHVRLGFAVAAHLQPDILLVDEVLAVGDVAFQKKCLGKMDEVRKQGRTIFLVSHNLATIANLCHRAILMGKGTVSVDGSVQQAIDQYLGESSAIPAGSLADRKDRGGRNEVFVSAIQYLDQNGTVIEYPLSGRELRIRVHYQSRVNRVFRNCRIIISINREDRAYLVLSTDLVDSTPLHLRGNSYVDFIVPDLPLFGGKYYLHAGIESESRMEGQDWILSAAEMTVMDGDFYGTGRLYPHDGWRGQGVPVKHRWEAGQTSGAAKKP